MEWAPEQSLLVLHVELYCECSNEAGNGEGVAQRRREETRSSLPARGTNCVSVRSHRSTQDEEVEALALALTSAVAEAQVCGSR